MLNEMKTGRNPGPSDVSLELIAASGKVTIKLMFEMPESSRLIVNVSLMGTKYRGISFHGKGEIRNCSCYRALKLHEHGLKVIEKVL